MPILQKGEENIPMKTTAIIVVVAIILSFLISLGLMSFSGTESSEALKGSGTVIVQITPENNQGTIQVNFKEPEDIKLLETP